MTLPEIEDIKIMITNAFEKQDLAVLIYGHGYYKDSASRLYYAVFYVLSALLFTKGLNYASHHQVIGAINREFVKTGIFPQNFKKKIEALFNSRQAGDYELKSTITKEDVDFLMVDTEEIIQQGLIYLQKLYQVSPDFWKK